MKTFSRKLWVLLFFINGTNHLLKLYFTLQLDLGYISFFSLHKTQNRSIFYYLLFTNYYLFSIFKKIILFILHFFFSFTIIYDMKICYNNIPKVYVIKVALAGHLRV